MYWGFLYLHTFLVEVSVYLITAFEKCTSSAQHLAFALSFSLFLFSLCQSFVLFMDLKDPNPLYFFYLVFFPSFFLDVLILSFLSHIQSLLVLCPLLYCFFLYYLGLKTVLGLLGNKLHSTIMLQIFYSHPGTNFKEFFGLALLLLYFRIKLF